MLISFLPLKKNLSDFIYVFSPQRYHLITHFILFFIFYVLLIKNITHLWIIRLACFFLLSETSCLDGKAPTTRTYSVQPYNHRIIKLDYLLPSFSLSPSFFNLSLSLSLDLIFCFFFLSMIFSPKFREIDTIWWRRKNERMKRMRESKS